MKTWYVVSRIETHASWLRGESPTLSLYLVRTWSADDYEHAMEQHMDAFPEEEVVCASLSEPMFYGSVKA